MPVKHIRVRHAETGAVAELPDCALPHFPAWVPVDDEAPAEAPAPEPETTTTADGGTDTKKGGGRRG